MLNVYKSGSARAQLHGGGADSRSNSPGSASRSGSTGSTGSAADKTDRAGE